MSDDEIRISLAEAVGEIREAIRVTLQAEAIVLVKGDDWRSTVQAAGLFGDAFDHVLGRMSRNIAMRLVGKDWGK